MKSQVEKMKQELKAMSQSDAQSKKGVSSETITKKEPLSFIEEMKKDFLKKGKATKGKGLKKEDDLLKKMNSFSSFIKSASKAKPKSNSITSTAKNEDEEKECALHFVIGCQSCRDTFGNQVDDDDDDGWMNTKLKFKKEVGANVFQPKVDDYTVVDPRDATSTGASDIFGRNAKSGKAAWKDRSLLKK